MALCGLGFGFFQSPNNRAMVTAAPMHRCGAAGGALATARLLGQTAGAVTTAVFFHLAGTAATRRRWPPPRRWRRSPPWSACRA